MLISVLFSQVKNETISYLCTVRQRIPYDQFDPALTIRENADKLHCSVSSIKQYLRKNDIDNQYDSSYIRWKTIHDYKLHHPSASLKSISSALGYSVNTIRKYSAMSEAEFDVSFRDTTKVSKFDIKNRNAIKTVSCSQTEILRWIIQLYNNGQTFDADLTASKCYFWKQLPRPEHLYDKYPQLEVVHPLSEADALPDESFQSVIFDLPFIVSGGAMSLLKERFTYFDSVEELFQANDEMLERSFRLLQPEGLLVVKTMDVSFKGKQYWVSDYVLRLAQDMGLELLEKFILTSNLRLFSKTRHQHMARKFHSYFFVFKKQ